MIKKIKAVMVLFAFLLTSFCQPSLYSNTTLTWEEFVQLAPENDLKDIAVLTLKKLFDCYTSNRLNEFQKYVSEDFKSSNGSQYGDVPLIFQVDHALVDNVRIKLEGVDSVTIERGDAIKLTVRFRFTRSMQDRDTGILIRTIAQNSVCTFVLNKNGDRPFKTVKAPARFSFFGEVYADTNTDQAARKQETKETQKQFKDWASSQGFISEKPAEQPAPEAQTPPPAPPVQPAQNPPSAPQPSGLSPEQSADYAKLLDEANPNSPLGNQTAENKDRSTTTSGSEQRNPQELSPEVKEEVKNFYDLDKYSLSYGRMQLLDMSGPLSFLLSSVGYNGDESITLPPPDANQTTSLGDPTNGQSINSGAKITAGESLHFGFPQFQYFKLNPGQNFQISSTGGGYMQTAPLNPEGESFSFATCNGIYSLNITTAGGSTGARISRVTNGLSKYTFLNTDLNYYPKGQIFPPGTLQTLTKGDLLRADYKFSNTSYFFYYDGNENGTSANFIVASDVHKF